MTKFIFDTKSIMNRAWVLAREYRAVWAEKEKRHSKWRNANMNLRACFCNALREAWNEAKSAKPSAAAKIEAPAKNSTSKKRYVELLSVAVRDGLNHGRSWALNSDTCSACGFNPMNEGDLVCYVYSN